MKINFDSPNKGDKVFIWLGWVGCDNFHLSSVKKKGTKLPRIRGSGETLKVSISQSMLGETTYLTRAPMVTMDMISTPIPHLTAMVGTL
jgi:hypothetical protein